MPPNILRCIGGKTVQQKIILPKMSVMSRLRDPKLVTGKLRIQTQRTWFQNACSVALLKICLILCFLKTIIITIIVCNSQLVRSKSWDWGLLGGPWQSTYTYTPEGLVRGWSLPERISGAWSLITRHQYLKNYFECHHWVTFYWENCIAEIDTTTIKQTCVLHIKLFSLDIFCIMMSWVW